MALLDLFFEIATGGDPDNALESTSPGNPPAKVEQILTGGPKTLIDRLNEFCQSDNDTLEIPNTPDIRDTIPFNDRLIFLWNDSQGVWFVTKKPN